MHAPWVRFLMLGVIGAALAFAGCGSGSDGDPGPAGPSGADGADGADGGSAVNIATAPNLIEGVDVVCEITSVTIASPPVVTFTLFTETGLPIVGGDLYFDPTARSPFYRFTIAKLVPGTGNGPSSWVAYIEDEDGPTYDHGESLVDNGDGSYVFTFETDIANIEGIPYEENLTHRVAGQVGRLSVVPLEEQNPWLDFVPAGGDVTEMRNIAVMESCNECHDNLRFHGRRFKVEYCVNCHTADLAMGEGNMAFMTHRIHAAGTFDLLDGGLDYGEVTYPQDLANCRKCHNGDDAATAQGDNWRTVENSMACLGCHDEQPEDGPHGAWPDLDCFTCHDGTIAVGVDEAHLIPNATPNNPDLLPGQFEMAYELTDATVDGAGVWTVRFKVLADGVALDLTSLPADFNTRRPGILLAYAMPQDGIDEPMDYNNLGRRGGQPLSVSLTNPPTVSGVSVGSYLPYAGDVNTVVIDNATYLPPAGATLRAAGLQGYFQQIIGMDTVSLHTPSAVIAVTGDDERRTVVDSMNCGDCHEWFEGHGGNRVGGVMPGDTEDNLSIQICTLCHLPNQSSSGRTINPADNPTDDPNDPDTPEDILAYPEDAQNFKDLIHGIHSEGFRTRHFEHVRGPTREGFYDWSHITFPRGASTSNCTLCHKSGTYELPLAEGLLPTTVRTTLVDNGQDDPPNYSDPGDPDATPPIDPDPGFPFSPDGGVEDAFQNVSNLTDWINTPTASSCFYCHTSADAMAHMMQNGALLSIPDVGPWTNRAIFGQTYESCSVCHGPGKTADVEVVHNR